MVCTIHRVCFICHVTTPLAMVYNVWMHISVESRHFSFSEGVLFWKIRGKCTILYTFIWVLLHPALFVTYIVTKFKIVPIAANRKLSLIYVPSTVNTFSLKLITLHTWVDRSSCEYGREISEFKIKLIQYILFFTSRPGESRVDSI